MASSGSLLLRLADAGVHFVDSRPDRIAGVALPHGWQPVMAGSGGGLGAVRWKWAKLLSREAAVIKAAYIDFSLNAQRLAKAALCNAKQSRGLFLTVLLSKFREGYLLHGLFSMGLSMQAIITIGASHVNTNGFCLKLP